MIAAVALAAGTWAWFHVLPCDTYPVGLDNLSEFARAHDCVRFGRCPAIEADAVAGLCHGPMWIYFLVIVEKLGGGMTAARELVFALYGVTTATMFVVVRHRLQPALALPAALLVLCAFPEMPMFHMTLPALMTTASLLFVPSALCSLALLVYATDRSEWALSLAALLCAVSINWHATGLTLLPGVVVAPLLISQRPGRSLIRVVVVVLAACALLSMTLLTSDIQGQWREGRLPLEIAGAAVLIGAAAALRPTILRMTPDGRAWVVMGALVLENGLALAWLVHADVFVNAYYAVPVALPAATGAAGVLVATCAAVCRRLSLREVWSSVVAVILATGALAYTNRNFGRETPDQWTFEDGQRVAKALSALGWSFSEAIDRLEEPHCHDLRHVATPYFPFEASPRNSKPESRQIRIWTRPARSTLSRPPGSELVALSHGRSAVISEVDAWLDPARARACPPGQVGGTGCDPLVLAPMPSDDASAVSRIAWMWRGEASVAGRTVIFDVQPAAGQTREIDFLSAPERGRACGWRVMRVSGLQVDRTLPAARVRLTSPDGAPAQVFLETDTSSPGCPWEGGPPCHMETTSEDRAFLAGGEGGQ